MSRTPKVLGVLVMQWSSEIGHRENNSILVNKIDHIGFRRPAAGTLHARTKNRNAVSGGPLVDPQQVQSRLRVFGCDFSPALRNSRRRHPTFLWLFHATIRATMFVLAGGLPSSLTSVPLCYACPSCSFDVLSAKFFNACRATPVLCETGRRRPCLLDLLAGSCDWICREVNALLIGRYCSQNCQRFWRRGNRRCQFGP